MMPEHMMEEERKMIIDAYNQWSDEIMWKRSRSILKNPEFSRMLRETGNKSFVKKHHNIDDHEFTHLMYCRSIALANPGSEEQAFAYGNRSAHLLHIGKFQECIQDIDRAFSISKTNTYHIKLLCRKAKCLAKLDSPDAQKTLEKAKFMLKKEKQTKMTLLKLIRDAQGYLDKCNQDTKMKINQPSDYLPLKQNVKDNSSVASKYDKSGNYLVSTKDMCKQGKKREISKPTDRSLNENVFSSIVLKYDNKTGNYLITTKDKCEQDKKEKTDQSSNNLSLTEKPSNFGSVTLKYDNKYGNHLITTKDIKPGEIIFTEKPYVSTLNRFKTHFFCSHCFVMSWAMIPCDSCTWCMFCSEKCKKEAWEQYHDIECIVFSFMRTNDDDECFLQTSIRSLILGIKEAGSIAKLKSVLQSIEKTKDSSQNLFKNGKIEDNGFKTLFSLCGNIQSLNVQRKYSVLAVQALFSLARNSSIFGKKFSVYEYRNLIENEDAVFIGSLILRLIKISYICGQEILNRGLPQKCEHPEHATTCWYRGFCIANISSFINHSCNPNTSRCFTEDNKVIVYALRPIQKGTQIFERYQYSFHELSNPFRRNKLKLKYGFMCDCEPCKENWPMYTKNFEPHTCQCPKETKTPLELELLRKNANIIDVTERTENTEYTKEEFLNLVESIEKATKKLPQTSSTTHKLISTLEAVFNRMHGGWLKIPDQCMKF